MSRQLPGRGLVSAYPNLCPLTSLPRSVRISYFANGKLHCKEMDAAKEQLDRTWDDYFAYAN